MNFPYNIVSWDADSGLSLNSIRNKARNDKEFLDMIVVSRKGSIHLLFHCI